MFRVTNMTGSFPGIHRTILTSFSLTPTSLPVALNKMAGLYLQCNKEQQLDTVVQISPCETRFIAIRDVERLLTNVAKNI